MSRRIPSPPLGANTHASPRRTAWVLEMAVIAAGGALGAVLRHSLAVSTQAAGGHSALSTALVNLLGSFLLGMLTGRLTAAGTHPLLRPFLAVGLLGSFTTFSALVLDNRLVAAESGEVAAALALLASILSGLAAFIVGDRCHTGHTREQKRV